MAGVHLEAPVPHVGRAARARVDRPTRGPSARAVQSGPLNLRRRPAELHASIRRRSRMDPLCRWDSQPCG
eukprot:5824566-Alexandrium_andersonii.AAC.1